MGGGGFVTGLETHPRQKDLIYARTDVGGAYRWDAAARRWISLTDWISMADNNLMGIESIALDPLDSNRVYLAAGTYDRGNAAILRSDDQGRTFQRTDVPFKMGGNEMGRFNGERLAVDPNQGEIIFFGSRLDGLWKSADRGATWHKVQSFLNTGSTQPSPAGSDAAASPRRRGGAFGQQQAVGIVSVVFAPSSAKPGQPTPTLYAAVSTTGTNLYRSNDGGAAWEAMEGQPIGLRPNHLLLAPDGVLYLTCGREPGPNTMTDGAVWKCDPARNAWTDITPVKPAASDQPFGYGDITVDALHPSTIMVTTFAHWHPHDEIFRSTNSGASWTPLWSQAQWDFSSAPYTQSRTPHWMGDIKINPFNSDQVLFTTGYGIWSCRDVTQADAGKPTHWTFLDDGLEETVPLALISPPLGPHLVSGVGDIDGFRHDNLNDSPQQGLFQGPRYGNTEDLAFAGLNPAVLVRSGAGGDGSVRAAISMDGGSTWKALASEPPNRAGAGAITISADGKIIVWTPRQTAPHFTLDLGTTWTPCAGLASGARVVADAVNPARFYSFDASAGKLLASTNGAAAFAATPIVLPATGSGFGGANNSSLSPAPGVEGDLWLVLRDSGLYHLTDAGAASAKIQNVQEAFSVGFGMAAPGKVYPALYLAGSVRGLQAIFRSDDAGATWVRINDDAHQYGWVSHVTGDPRVYGRVYFATGGRGVIYGEPSAQ
jgi:photosystem II stability/assembly factor-like uncharacterized protein